MALQLAKQPHSVRALVDISDSVYIKALKVLNWLLASYLHRTFPKAGRKGQEWNKRAFLKLQSFLIREKSHSQKHPSRLPFILLWPEVGPVMKETEKASISPSETGFPQSLGLSTWIPLKKKRGVILATNKRNKVVSETAIKIDFHENRHGACILIKEKF